MPDQEERARTSEEYDEDAIIRHPAFEKWEYRKIFHPSNDYVGSSTRGSFYALALLSVELIVKRIVEGYPQMDYEGTAALFLFRHYLELTLKQIVLSTRYLENTQRNALKESVEMVANKHYLINLWQEAKENISQKLGGEVWEQWDYNFVEQCVKEFHGLDPKSTRLRYERIHEKDDLDPCSPVLVDWQALLRGMQHTHDVLENIVTCLIETYGLNADWEAEQSSW